MPPIEGGQSLAEPISKRGPIFCADFCKLRLTKGLQKVVILVDRFTEGIAR
jgi:hypothetical protein